VIADLAIGVVCAAFLVWFARRARVGRKSRAAAGVRSRALARFRSRRAGTIFGRAAGGALGGMFLGGVPMAIAGSVVGAISEPIMRARASRGRDRRIDAQLPDVMRALSAAVRAGRSVPQALEAARDEARDPIRMPLDRAVGMISVGAPLTESLDAFASDCGTLDAALVVETLKIGRAAGGNLPLILDVAVESLSEREQIARDRRATSAQAKMSALVVALMPVAFFAIVGSGARDQVHVLFGDPVGWVLLGCGLILEAGGALWMRALLRPR
jgi:tight adherence protein B